MINQNFLPSLVQLKAFVSIAHHHHFGAAAAELKISQPTLSQSLALLETGLGVQLIERSTRKVITTEIGHQLLPLAENIIAHNQAFLSAVSGLSENIMSGVMRLGIIPTVAPYLLPKILPELSTVYPQLELIICEDQTQRLITQLKNGAIDAAIIALGVGALTANLEKFCQEVHLYDEDFVLAVPKDHPLAYRCDISIPDLYGSELLLLDDGHCLRNQALDICRKTGGNTKIGVADTRAASLHTIMHCVAQGWGITLLPELSVPSESNNPAIEISYFAPPAPSRRIGLIFRSTSTKDKAYHAIAQTISQAVR